MKENLDYFLIVNMSRVLIIIYQYFLKNIYIYQGSMDGLVSELFAKKNKRTLN